MDDRRFVESFPLPIARGLRRHRNAAEVREAHDAAYYLFEVYLKYTASAVIARYLGGERRDHRLNAVLKGLARPSLGEWLRFLRECLRFLAEEPEPDPTIRPLAELFEGRHARWGEAVSLANALRSERTGRQSEREGVSLADLLGEVVAYRNRVLGHGAPLAAERYERLGGQFSRAFLEVLDASPFLSARRLIAFDSVQVEGSRVECRAIEYMGLAPARRATGSPSRRGSTG